MPANRRIDARAQQLVLILSQDPLAAALLGGLVEILGYSAQFARPAESADDSIRRLKPRICLVDSTDPSCCRSEFLGHAAMRGVSILIYGKAEALDRVRELARAHNIDTLLMPPELDALEAAMLSAIA